MDSEMKDRDTNLPPVTNRVFWPPDEKQIPADSVPESRCFTIRYRPDDFDLREQIKRIPYSFGCKYRTILWAHLVRRDTRRRRHEALLLKNFRTRMNNFQENLVEDRYGPQVLPPLPNILRNSREIQRKYRELSELLARCRGPPMRGKPQESAGSVGSAGSVVSTTKAPAAASYRMENWDSNVASSSSKILVNNRIDGKKHCTSKKCVNCENR